jgi:hypothetical protein
MASLISYKDIPILYSKSKINLRKISTNNLANRSEEINTESNLNIKKEIEKFKIFIDKEKLTDKNLNLKIKYLIDNIEDIKDNVLSEIDIILKIFKDNKLHK